VSFRTYRDVAGDDRSRLAEQVEAQRQRVSARLGRIGRVVAVMSGKGGVGKSFVTAALARHLAPRLAGGVGVLDADLGSPTVARMLGARGPLRVDAEGVHPAATESGARVLSSDLLLDDGAPLEWTLDGSDRFVWRGLLEAGALREFLGDVAWGPLALLLVDLPPGTDRLQDLAGLVPDMAGAVAVTLPSEESRRSVERAMRGGGAAGVPLLGVVENMSGYACAGCGVRGPLFEGNAGDRLARAFGLPLLARVPFAAGAVPPALAAACAALGDRLMEILS
jgi:ATP-binding protein involved in chromosome partitioning